MKRSMACGFLGNNKARELFLGALGSYGCFQEGEGLGKNWLEEGSLQAGAQGSSGERTGSGSGWESGVGGGPPDECS